jgi:hypothetical protein
MKRAILVLGLCLLAAAPSFAAMRCGVKLVSEGDTRSEVAVTCGEPTEIVKLKSVFRRPVIWTRNGPYFVGEDLIEIPVEAWIYNLGPNKLMRRLRFEDGVLAEIETLGYGYNK